MAIRTAPAWMAALLGLALTPPATAEPPPPIPLEGRLQHTGLQQAILEALAFLEDNQVRNRPGRGSPLCDSTCEGDGSRGRTNLNFGRVENVGVPGRCVSNRTGEWTSQINLVPRRLGCKGRTILSMQDSNAFVTACVAWTLLRYDDSGMPCERRCISTMLDLAVANLATYRRNGSYNFWPLLPGVSSRWPRSGPPNVGIPLQATLSRIYVTPGLNLLLAPATCGVDMPERWWVAAALDRCQNPAGPDALFNVPNDSDTTALAVAVQTLYGGKYPDHGPPPDLAALAEVARYRDLNRSREHPRDFWKHVETGAYLTWLKDENEPVFGDPCTGIIPYAANNVDAVVNANVVMALGVSGGKDMAGYDDALGVLAQTVHEKLWPPAGLYYQGQCMMFPYAVSRAYRDGGARTGPMEPAMRVLLSQLLEIQACYGRTCPHRWGAFPGGEDPSDHLSTAFGLCALLNLGRTMADELGKGECYDRAVLAAVDYLIRQRKGRRIVNPSTHCCFGGAVDKVGVWESGVVFTSITDLTYWRSQAMTAGVVAEGLGKFVLGYDLHGAGRIALTPRPECPGSVTLMVIPAAP